MSEDFSSSEFLQLMKQSGGEVKPLRGKDLVQGFGRSIKTPNRRLIEAQHERYEDFEEVAVNLDGISEEAFKALCEGRVRISRCIDLHGYYVDEGIRVLQDALHHRENYRRQCWLIVHGKGRRSARYEVKAPLRSAVLSLLKRHPAIAAFAIKQDFDKDSGSVLIEVHAKY
ncbi:MAG: Smr/MutS family protein [Cardiobacteriaceae bacterium]|nr:Smr/MutS family protein [Cardiobacteriaceae bacterium]